MRSGDLAGSSGFALSGGSDPLLPWSPSHTLAPPAEESAFSRASGNDGWPLQSPASCEQHCHFRYADCPETSSFDQKLVFLLSCAVWSRGGGITFSMKHSLGLSPPRLGCSPELCSWKERAAHRALPPQAQLALSQRAGGLVVSDKITDNHCRLFSPSQC